mgnify:FL=1
MIKNSFVFLEKVTPHKEQSIWGQGIHHWTDFLRSKKIKGIPPEKKHYHDRQIWEALKALQEDNSSYFVGKFPAKEMWRLYDYFKDQCCFLDIETDSHGRITVVGISNYYHTASFVQGFNLEKEQVEQYLQKYKLVVTFNGSSFDLPRLKKQLGIILSIPHIDLKPLYVNLGLTGGLKEVELTLDLKRPPHLYGNPVELWNAFHASGDKEWLELLLDYNREDIENLRAIMEHVYARKAAEVQKYINSTSFILSHGSNGNTLGNQGKY